MTLLTAQEVRLKIRSAQQMIGLWTFSREEIVLATCAHESLLCREMKQIGGGPARGGFGIEPNTEVDCWRYLGSRMKQGQIGWRIAHNIGIDHPTPQALVDNFDYACSIATVKYYMSPEPLPMPNDLQGMADYWWKHYNCSSIDRRQKFMDDYRRLVLEEK